MVNMILVQEDIVGGYINGFFDFIRWVDGLFLLAGFLIIADLYFGIMAANARKEVVRKSRAVKRTLNKVCSYLLWLIIAYIFGEEFGKPMDIDFLPLIMLLVIYGVEIESIYSNYFESKGIKAKINFMKFFSKKTDIIEIEESTDKDEK